MAVDLVSIKSRWTCDACGDSVEWESAQVMKGRGLVSLTAPWRTPAGWHFTKLKEAVAIRTHPGDITTMVCEVTICPCCTVQQAADRQHGLWLVRAMSPTPEAL